jgi:hypothetical protein
MPAPYAGIRFFKNVRLYMFETIKKPYHFARNGLRPLSGGGEAVSSFFKFFL